MRIFSNSSATVVSTFLLSAAVMTTRTTDAFTPFNIKNINVSKNSATAVVLPIASSALSASDQGQGQEQEPCDMPSDVEEVTLKNSKSLRSAIVTNIDGEEIALGDMMGIEKDMTSVVVFLRHMG